MASDRNAGAEDKSCGGSLAIASIVTAISTVIILVVLIVWTAVSSGIISLEANDDDDGALKTLLNLLVLVIACGALFVPMKRGWRPSEGPHDRFNLGVLAAYAFLVGNMFFVSFWYLVNLTFGEEDDGNTYQKVTCYVSLCLAFAFCILSALIFNEGKKLPETDHRNSNSSRSNSESKAVQVTSAAHLEMMSQIWNLLSSSTVAIVAMLFIVACVMTRGEDAQRIREEGGINLIIILLWMIVVATGMSMLGRKTLGENKLGSFGAGLLSGSTMYFSLLLFLVFILYSNLTAEERREEDGVWIARAISFAFFFLSLLHLSFSLGTYKYQKSIIEVNLEKDTSSGLKRVLFSRKK